VKRAEREIEQMERVESRVGERRIAGWLWSTEMTYNLILFFFSRTMMRPLALVWFVRCRTSAVSKRHFRS
jgi:hypothetical protein